MNEIVKVIQVDATSVQEYVNTLKDANTEVSQLTNNTQSYNNVAGDLNKQTGTGSTHVKQMSSNFKEFNGELSKANPGVKDFNAAIGKLKTAGLIFAELKASLELFRYAVNISEGNAHDFNLAMSQWQPTIDSVKRVLDTMGKGVSVFLNLIKTGQVILRNWNMTFAEILGDEKTYEKLERRNRLEEQYVNLAERRNVLDIERRKINEEVAIIEARISQNRTLALDTESENLQLNVQAIERWKQLAKEKYNIQKQLLEQQIAIAEEEQRLSPTDTKAANALSDLRVRLINLSAYYAEQEKIINRASKTVNNAIKRKEEESKATEKAAYEDRKRAAKEFARDIEDINSDINNYVEDFIKRTTQTQITFDNNIFNQFSDAASDALTKANAKLSAIDQDTDNKLFWNLLGIKDPNVIYDTTYDIMTQGLQAAIDADELSLQNADLVGAERIAIEQRVAANKEALSRKQAEYAQELADREEAINQAKINSLFQLADATGQVFTQIASMQEQGSEEQKAYAIMGATINTIATGVSAVRSIWQSAPNPIIAAIQTAATVPPLVAGLVAQIKQIKATKKGSDSGAMVSPGSVGSGLSGIKTSPLLNKETDLTAISTINVSKDKEATRVYVLESDISDAVKHQNVKVEESSW